MKRVFRLGVITPTYNRPELLVRLHKSLTESGDVDWMHYVVDDGSTADYHDAVRRCEVMSERLKFCRIRNSGPLIARNEALECAMRDGCTHLTFFDDDDEMIPGGDEAIARRVRQFPSADWFMFPSVGGEPTTEPWPPEPTVARWFEDVVCARKFGSDNAVVVSSSLVGSTRFSTRGRNQREWTFFLELSAKNNQVLVCPDPIRSVQYLDGGLSVSAAANKTVGGVTNNIVRSYKYWIRRPFSGKLFLSLFGQLAAAPLRYFSLLVSSLRESAAGSRQVR